MNDQFQQFFAVIKDEVQLIDKLFWCNNTYNKFWVLTLKSLFDIKQPYFIQILQFLKLSV